MHNLQETFRRCYDKMVTINMDVSPHITSVKVNNRLSRALGRCTFRNGYYTIEINPCLLEDGADIFALENTIMHELIHTCPGCMNHGPRFQLRANYVNLQLGYRVQTTTEIERLEAQGVKLRLQEFKYALVCNNCEHMYKRKKWSKVLENPDNYRCGKCGGTLRTISLDENMEVVTVSANNVEG